MISLKQKELKEWQERNFPTDGLMSLSKEELVKIILILQVTLGINEEAGEVAHHVLKGTQSIRGGVKGINKKEVANGVGDNLIYGTQLLSLLNMDVEVEVKEVIEEVLARDWVKFPKDGISDGGRKIDVTSIDSSKSELPIKDLPCPLCGIHKTFKDIKWIDKCQCGITEVYHENNKRICCNCNLPK